MLRTLSALIPFYGLIRDPMSGAHRKAKKVYCTNCLGFYSVHSPFSAGILSLSLSLFTLLCATHRRPHPRPHPRGVSPARYTYINPFEYQVTGRLTFVVTPLSNAFLRHFRFNFFVHPLVRSGSFRSRNRPGFFHWTELGSVNTAIQFAVQLFSNLNY